ncbi:mobilome CxxCx(11)CxxC protein [Sphingobacterium corticibacter]|uniref:DUF4231 domain-containing protein n=1 Tax=Sphingobacterium corticibacter TaxID=2171749 RepID=A0A2T8HNI6_9SPHI|nr:mobilome CxxCx(11)CxxC protein [Sphingobacterium corticibacter]PVH26996.1 hypothetical protein DC487_05215 [Sphingobacterium corticibacter]
MEISEEIPEAGNNDRPESNREKCWNYSLQSFGKSYIFNNRARFYETWLRRLSLLGVIVPIMVGATAMAYNLDTPIFNYILALSAPLSLLQVLMSCFSLVNKWDDKYSYAIEAINEHDNLSEAFKKLATSNGKGDVSERKFEKLETRLISLNKNDSKQLITDRERRMGMRSGLREFQRGCAGCGEIPISMQSTKCPVCGEFEKKNITKHFTHG